MFTVMTYNVGNGVAGAPDLVSYLRKADADFVGRQELTDTQAEALAGNLGDVYPYRALFGTGTPGKGVLSRYPLVETRQLHLSPARPELRAVVDLAGMHLTVIVAHTRPPRLRDPGRRTHPATPPQLRDLADLARTQAPAELLGQFSI